MEATSQPKPQVSSDQVARFLEDHGWTKKVAGDYDFDLAVRGIVASEELHKGLVLIGEAGVGKSSLLSVIRKGVHPHGMWFSCKEREDLVNLISPAWDFLMLENVFLDDIGFEKETTNNLMVDYEKHDAVNEFIQKFYDRKAVGRIYGSSNHGSEWLNQHYDGRFFDRLCDMCVVVKFSGKTKRTRTIIK